MQFPSLPPVVKNLLIVNIIVWLAMLLFPTLDRSIMRLLSLHYFESPGFNIAQLFSYMFLHSGFMHLFFNMFALVVFGGIIERTIGSKRFMLYYISCGVMAALIQMIVYAFVLADYKTFLSPDAYQQVVNQGWSLIQNGQNYADPILGTINSLVNGEMVGASGAVYGIILAFGMLYPNQPIYIWFIPIPIKAKWLVIGYFVIELVSGISNFMVDNVAHFAHLGGMIAGFFLILYWKKKGIFNNHWFF